MNKIEWTLKAVKQMKKIPDSMQEQIFSAIDTLLLWPNVKNVKSLAGRSDYRLRSGQCRIIFRVLPTGDITIIVINEVKKRDERTY